MTKQQANISRTQISIMSKILSHLPTSVPSTIYKIASAIPLCKMIMNKIILSKIPEQIQIPEGILLLDQTDVAVSGAIALGAFENTEIELFRTCLKPHMNIVDIGANIGFYSIISAKHVGATGKVFAFEPEDRNYSFLQKNIKINNFANIITKKIGISNKYGEVNLYLDTDNKGHHSMAFEENKQVLVMKIDTLDNLLKPYDSPKIDIIKIDIEGAEFLALEGMKETIRRSPNLIIFTEFFPEAITKLGGKPLQYLQELQNMGFSLSIISNDSKQGAVITDLELFVRSFTRTGSFKNLIARKG